MQTAATPPEVSDTTRESDILSLLTAATHGSTDSSMSLDSSSSCRDFSPLQDSINGSSLQIPW